MAPSWTPVMTDTIDVSGWTWQLFDRADPAQAMLRTPAVLVLNDSEQARLRELEARFYRLFPSVTQGTALMLFRLSDAPTATALVRCDCRSGTSSSPARLPRR